ncbi:hypothetical protein M422DRAFT_163892, partial [Sphaerobolus stellatus SS14]
HFLKLLGDVFLNQFKRSKNIGELVNAVGAYHQACQGTFWNETVAAIYMSDYGTSLFMCHEQFGDIADLNESVLKLQEAVQLTPNGYPDKPSRLNNLGNSLLTRFEQTGDMTDLNESVLKFQEAVLLTPNGNPDKPSWLNNLGNSLLRRFKQTGDMVDLNGSVLKFQEAVQLTPDGDTNMPSLLNNLGNSFLRRFEETGDMTDLNKSVLKLQEAVQLTPDGYSHKPALLNNLGSSILRRFEQTGDMVDLNGSVLKSQEAVQLTPDGHPDKPLRLNNLGNSLLRRFEQTGDMTDLNESVLKLQEAVQLTPDSHPDKPSWLNNLGSSLLTRFEQTGDITDLNKSILKLQEAVQLSPDSHPEKPSSLDNLGNSLLTKFEQTGDMTYLDESVLKKQEAVELSPDGHPDKPTRLNNLGNSLLTRFEQTGDMTNLNNSVLKFQEAAVELSPDGHPDKPSWLNNLGNSLLRRFDKTGDMTDLNDSVLKFQEAVQLTSDGHPDKPSWLYNLGNSLLAQFEEAQPSDHTADIMDALLAYASAAQAEYGPPSVRLRAAQRWAFCLQVSPSTSQSILDPYHIAIPLISEMVWLGSSLSDRHHQIMHAGNIVHEAVAAAHKIGNHIQAIEWLEQGRSVIWSQLLQLHTPLDDLAEQHPTFCQKLKLNTFQLQQVASHQNLKKISKDGHQLAVERKQLLKDIRMFPGFERFLLPKSIAELTPAASHGPIVILNISEIDNMCYALILHSKLLKDVLPVKLESFSAQQAKSLYLDLQKLLHEDGRTNFSENDSMLPASDNGNIGHTFKEVLVELWKHIAKPILDALAFMDPLPKSKSRIWWCPTGLLSFLPIHAAGMYDKDAPSGSKLSDFVISSYTPTISAMLDRIPPTSSPLQRPRLLAIAQSSSSNQNQLPGTTEEIEYIEHAVGEALTISKLTEENATLQNIVSEIQTSNWVHFACHGVQDPAHPLQSALLLAGKDRLTLQHLTQLKLTHGGLAFLSACQTAKGDKNLSDEAVHLGAGMLFTGFQGVIATMWSVADHVAPKVARDVYQHLKESELNVSEAAHGLHLAVETVRKDIGGDDNASFISWVPFIHIGR